jgi:hypothetical protein
VTLLKFQPCGANSTSRAEVDNCCCSGTCTRPAPDATTESLAQILIWLSFTEVEARRKTTPASDSISTMQRYDRKGLGPRFQAIKRIRNER